MTFSILARDPASGTLGVAAQTAYLAVGVTVAWARPGIGAAATQALTEPAHGPDALRLLGEGHAAGKVLESVLAGDSHPKLRQVGVVDAGGEIAVHTGSRCLRHAGHVVAADHAALANVARHRGLPEAMSRAFAAATGSPARRLVAALAAGESHGGDLRGRQSASVLVVSGDPRDPPWSSLVDLRVDDHADPLGELARLLDRQEAFGQLSLGLNLLFVGRADAARPHLDAAAALDPDDEQIGFWAGFARGAVDDPGPDWRELRRRIAEAGILQVPPADPQP